MNQAAYALFETPLGTCGIAWKESRNPVVTFFQLPEATRALTEARIARLADARRSGTPPPLIAGIIRKVQKHLNGEAQDFQGVIVDLDGTAPFAKQVYAAARKIPSGRIITYGELAKGLGRSGAGRAVGLAMGRNPIPLIIPCHRVVAAGNKPGGFSAHGGRATKVKMLEIEGAVLGPPPTIKSVRDLKRAAALLEKRDPRLSRVLSKQIEFRLKPEHSPYETLIEAVVHQQLSPKAAGAILGRVAALYPGPGIPAPDKLLKTPDRLLRGAGLSKAKTAAIKDIARKTLEGIVPSSREILSLSDKEIIHRLTSIYGVGRWTVEMVLIFNLGRMDVLPADDYALRKRIAGVFGMKGVPTPQQVRTVGESWRPFRTAASLFLWNYIE